MRKFSQRIISESDDIFRIRVVVSDLNSEFRIFSEVNSEFFSEVIRSIRTIPNFFPSSFGQFRTDFRIICGNKMEIYQNPLFFHENIFFLIRKSLNTLNSIFRANIRNLLLRVTSCWLHSAASCLRAMSIDTSNTRQRLHSLSRATCVVDSLCRTRECPFRRYRTP